MFRLKNKKGQSTIEYVVMATAVISLIILGLTSFKQKVTNVHQESTNSMKDMGERLHKSYKFD